MKQLSCFFGTTGVFGFFCSSLCPVAWMLLRSRLGPPLTSTAPASQPRQWQLGLWFPFFFFLGSFLFAFFSFFPAQAPAGGNVFAQDPKLSFPRRERRADFCSKSSKGKAFF